MRAMSSIKRICVCAICIALCYVLPIAMHALGLGSVFSPMHIPVLMCGLICGSFYGGFCGLAGPILSSVLSGMPPASALVTMLPELLVYGLITGLMMQKVYTGKAHLDIYISLITAMLLGRIAAGIARMIFVTFFAAGETFTIALWLTSYFVSGFPGIVAHLILVPLLVMTLMKVRIVPTRYLKTA